MPGVRINIVDDLPEGVTLAAEFGPGYIHMAIRSGMTQHATVREIAQAWQAIREEYGVARISALESAAS